MAHVATMAVSVSVSVSISVSISVLVSLPGTSGDVALAHLPHPHPPILPHTTTTQHTDAPHLTPTHSLFRLPPSTMAVLVSLPGTGGDVVIVADERVSSLDAVGLTTDADKYMLCLCCVCAVTVL